MADTQDREVLTWQGFGDATRQIAQNIVDSGWMPELVVAVARGGYYRRVLCLTR